MTSTEKICLSWLSHAMTDSPDSNISYYYDLKYRSFFYIKTPLYDTGGIEFYDVKGEKIYDEEKYIDLFIRLSGLSDELIEITRLNVAQKRDIQWQFLSRFCGHRYHFKYFIEVIDQREQESFVLDKLMKHENNKLYQLWEKFKLEVIRIYANSFAGKKGFELNFLI